MTQSMAHKNWDVEAIRKDFPLLQREVHGYPLVYFDNAATTQKPNVVLESMDHYYRYENANVHRSVHDLGARATEQYEQSREKIKWFINAHSVQECIFVRGATEAINLVANSYVTPRIKPGDEILITHMEHHANIVPWQMVCQKTGAVLKVAPISLEGEVDLKAFEALLSSRTKFVAINYVSNALGTINPVRQMIDMAHAVGAKVLVDGAQAIAHLRIDVAALDCDFYVFSGHKMFGPMGIGVLWGREALLDESIPYQGGGEMIAQVTFEATQYAPLPYKFEAGTPNVGGAIGLAAAIDYLSALDFKALMQYEAMLLSYTAAALEAVGGFNVIGTAAHKVPVVSFVHGGIHAHDVGTILDGKGVAVRSGHHCAMPLMDFYGVSATTRLSLSFYNTTHEIDVCMSALQTAKQIFG